VATIKRPAKKTTKAKTATAGVHTSGMSGANATKATGEAKPVIDRRARTERRSSDDRRKKDEPVAVERRVLQRRAKVTRRRQIDPTTCERDYSNDEIEFMNALDDYRRSSGRMFPTCSEVLEVIRKLGYEKRTPLPVIELPTPTFAAEQIVNSPAV